MTATDGEGHRSGIVAPGPDEELLTRKGNQVQSSSGWFALQSLGHGCQGIGPTVGNKGGYVVCAGQGQGVHVAGEKNSVAATTGVVTTVANDVGNIEVYTSADHDLRTGHIYSFRNVRRRFNDKAGL